MGLIEQIAELGGVNTFKHGSLVLIACEDATAFLDACKAASARVVGIEGFWLRGASVVPDMDAIADFSAVESVLVSVLEAKRFVENVGSRGLMLDFSLES